MITRLAFVRKIIPVTSSGGVLLRICFETCDGGSVAWPELRVPNLMYPGSALYRFLVAISADVVRIMESKRFNELDFYGKKCLITYKNNGEYYECVECRRH